MATQQIEFEAPSGLTLTCTLHPAGSDTIAYTASAVTEQTNRKGIYRATFSSVVGTFYQLIARSGSTGVASWWGFAQDTTQTFMFGTSTTRTDSYVASFISGQIATDIENNANDWDIATGVIGNQSAVNVWNSLTSSHTTNNTFGQRVLRSTTSQSTVAVTGSHHVAADIHEIQTGAIVDSDFAAGSIYAKLGTLIEADPVSGFRYTTQALEQAPSGGGGGGDASQATLLQVKAKTDQMVFTVANKVDATATFTLDAGVASDIAEQIRAMGVAIRAVQADDGTISLYNGMTYNDIAHDKLTFITTKDYSVAASIELVIHSTSDYDTALLTAAATAPTATTVEVTTLTASFTPTLTFTGSPAVCELRYSLIATYPSGTEVIASGPLYVFKTPPAV
jgi:hypothetical protein